jgi:hypothetical protein
LVDAKLELVRRYVGHRWGLGKILRGRTALVRKSRWACVKGLQVGAGFDEASLTHFGVLGVKI